MHIIWAVRVVVPNSRTARATMRNPVLKHPTSKKKSIYKPGSRTWEVESDVSLSSSLQKKTTQNKITFN